MKSICDITPRQFVFTVNLECSDPFAVVVNEDTDTEENYAIPRQLAYFLTTHWAGTEQLRDAIKRETLAGIRQTLGIK